MRADEEAAQILIRMFDTIAASMGKRLKEGHKAEIRRACMLLSEDGALDPLEDMPPMPRVSPAEAVMEIAERDPGYKRWKQERERE
jgi:uncharacterized protein CbrC (UPF0167 family)